MKYGHRNAPEPEEAPTPEHVVLLPPAAFADDWPKKPKDTVAIGLRRLSEADTEYARSEAEREMVGFYDQLIGRPRRPSFEVLDEQRNDAMMCIALARACCDPNDARANYFRAEEEAKVALTPQGVRRLYDEYLLFTTTTGGVPKHRATDEEARRLGTLLALGRLHLDDETRVLLAYVSDALGVDEQLEAAALEDDDEHGDDEAPAVAHYTAPAA